MTTAALLAALFGVAILIFSCYNPSKTSSEQKKKRKKEEDWEENKLTPPPSFDKKPSSLASHTAFLQFSIRCLQTVAKSTCIVISPLSLGASLALLMDAAKGETRQQIANLLDPGSNAQDIGNFISNLLEKFSHVSERITVATGIFVNKDIRISSTYADHAKNAYAAVTKNLDFSNANNSAKAVNEFIEEATKNLIRSSISTDAFRPNSGAFIVNAMHFDADWLNPFHRESTTTGTFYGMSGKRTETFMCGTRLERCSVYEDVTILSLPYTDPSFSFVLMMPSGDFVDWRQKLSAGFIEAAICNLPSEEQNATVCVPKFCLETDANMTETLQKMGLKTCFERGNADLSGLSPRTPFFVEKITQTSLFTVDEEGTRAATVTTAGYIAFCPPENMEFDKPFLYCVMQGRDVVYIGQYV